MKSLPFAGSLCLGLGLILNFNPSLGAEAAKAPLADRLASPPILSGRFTQEKRIVGLKKPLISTGDFLVVRDKGVIWRTQKPFAAAVAVTRKGIWSLKRTGADLKREPIHQGNLGAAMDMIQKVLAGDPASLAKAFSVTKESEVGGGGGWSLELKPLDPVVARVILSILLQGSKHVDRVEYSETNGDKTRIDFAGVADNAGELGSWQADAFRD
ncbi:MAG: outer rane lipoprotein carrier protein LolA [Fibrobacteres bacterium]|nr:outer rane lipoprotein carrier protein LolA [Fibrobacterota bacterium]